MSNLIRFPSQGTIDSIISDLGQDKSKIESLVVCGTLKDGKGEFFYDFNQQNKGTLAYNLVMMTKILTDYID